MFDSIQYFLRLLNKQGLNIYNYQDRIKIRKVYKDVPSIISLIDHAELLSCLPINNLPKQISNVKVNSDIITFYDWI